MMTQDLTKPLPEFAHPPVIETVIGVEFAPLQKWSIPHFGLYWQGIQDEFNQFELKQPLASQVEQFDPVDSFKAQPLELAIDPTEVRCWFIHPSGSPLLQVQKTRFILNWRKRGDEEYPRYENLRPLFEQYWTRFCEFVRGRDLGHIDVLQTEISYVNHIERGSVWTSAADLSSAIAVWSGQTIGEFLPAPENARFDVAYLFPNRDGRLRVSGIRALRGSDAKEVFQLSLTARCRPASSSGEDLRNALDLGHQWVVRGFADVTTPAAHKYWGRSK